MWKSGLLIVLFLFPAFAKPFHISYEKIICTESNGQSSHHDSEECPVCLFHYFAFTGIELPELNPELFPLSIEPFFYSEKVYQPFLYPYFLRGPPLL
jgi:hypothetical protein